MHQYKENNMLNVIKEGLINTINQINKKTVGATLVAFVYITVISISWVVGFPLILDNLKEPNGIFIASIYGFLFFILNVFLWALMTNILTRLMTEENK